MMLLLATMAPMVLMLGVLAWVVLVDSKSRWPRATAMQRLVNVLTFTR